MYFESSIYFYCDSLREGSQLRRVDWMEERERGGFISPSYKCSLGENDDIPFAEWQRFLEKNRSLLLKDCSSARIDVGIMADFQVADFTLSVPPELHSGGLPLPQDGPHPAADAGRYKALWHPALRGGGHG